MPFFLANLRHTLVWIVENVHEFDDVGVRKAFESFDFFIFLNFVDIGVAMFHDFECVFVSVDA